jgi:carboxylate-amine ligase
MYQPSDPSDVARGADRRLHVEGIEFLSVGELTLGVELELQIVDAASGELAPQAEAIIDAVNLDEAVKPELYLDMIEVNTAVCSNAEEAEANISRILDRACEAAAELGVGFAGTGSHPKSDYYNSRIHPSDRYDDLIDRNQWLTRRWKVYGLHVHIGMRSGEECIRFNNFFLRLLPHLLALSASAPFWQGQDTGLATCRPTMYESLPTAGLPYPVGSWGEFAGLCNALLKVGAIRSLKDLWWDVRPSPRFGTLEIRICDSPATLAETVAIVAFIHALAHWFRDHGEWLQQVPRPSRWLMRENKWRVIRHGLNAELVLNTDGESRLVTDDIGLWLEKISSSTDRLGYSTFFETLRDICA